MEIHLFLLGEGGMTKNALPSSLNQNRITVIYLRTSADISLRVPWRDGSLSTRIRILGLNRLAGF